MSRISNLISIEYYNLGMVILTYIVAKQVKEPNTLLGQNDREFAEILKWASFGNSDVMSNAINTFGGLTGRVPYNKKLVDTSFQKLIEITKVVEDRLYDYTYLVGDRLTLADLLMAQSYWRSFTYLFGKEQRQQFPNLSKWFNTVVNSDVLKAEFADFKFIDKTVEYVPPKKEKKEQAPKQAKPAAKKESKPADDDEEEDKPAPAPKHPLAALPKSKQAIDEWKRVYSNEETRETAIPWFWKNMYDPEEWSLYKVEYKYNDELTLTFMSNNLVGGFFNRLSASTKYLFGCLVVYGENNNNGITGFFLVRGQDYKPAFDVAPDWESYEYTKLDGNNEADRAYINNMLAWDEPVVINGEKREIADGKVFK